MATSKEKISRWFRLGVIEGATHMLVVCDTYDHTDYPVYIESDQDVLTVLKEQDGVNMRRVMECYALHLDKEMQMSERRAFHTEKKNA